ncbi:hypothetical protein H257_05579 [Aphanomyces astaci]|uniref:Uncharacterized protein n=1 Tax=Aphanomyces astaci TaxID=112090 RepID=W4GRX0_APHAT|nr:hypothetical protein H257_05579 [Aphanomyces astaci]ETV82061.1 hypothetical protein H257_05579 [Aphanomyces astaci]|eukprot:XP_009828798.1 hypothetical protein H257_05579 [Aphanomyces astaci]
MDGVMVVDLRGGGLVYSKALAASFSTRHPHKTHMNLAALLFAIFNYAGSVTRSGGGTLHQYETRSQRLVFGVAPAKQWLVVGFASPQVFSQHDHWWTTHRFADAVNSRLHTIPSESRASQGKRLHIILHDVLVDSMRHIGTTLCPVFQASTLVVYCTPPKIETHAADVRQAEATPLPRHVNRQSHANSIMVATATSKWKRRWHALWRTPVLRRPPSLHQVLPGNSPIIVHQDEQNLPSRRHILLECTLGDKRDATWTLSTVEGLVATSIATTRTIPSSNPPSRTIIPEASTNWLVLGWDRLHVVMVLLLPPSADSSNTNTMESSSASSSSSSSHVDAKLQTLLAIADTTWGLCTGGGS